MSERVRGLIPGSPLVLTQREIDLNLEEKVASLYFLLKNFTARLDHKYDLLVGVLVMICKRRSV